MAQGPVSGKSMQPGRDPQSDDNQLKAAQGFIRDGRLHKWCKEGKYKKVEEFIRTSKDLPLRLAHRRGLFGYTPLHEAASNGHSRVLELLLRHNGDVNCRAFSGCTPLYLASSSGHVNCVRVLLAHDADINNMDDDGKTPIQRAMLESRHGVVKILKSAGKCVQVFNCSYVAKYTYIAS